MAFFSPRLHGFAVIGFAITLVVAMVDARPHFQIAPRQDAIQNVTSPGSTAAAAPGACSEDWFTAALKEIAVSDPATKVSLVRIPKNVDAGGAFGGQEDDPENMQYGRITGLPALCAVKFHVEVDKTNKDPASAYDVGMFFPTAWNKGMITVGGESWGGGIHWPNMGEGAHRGFVAVSTNNGHNSLFFDTTWATGDGGDGRKQDWGFRAIHGSVVLGKALVAKYYESSEFKSYYSGCSTGGRQGLRELADHVDSFDGLLIGAPAWDTVDISPWMSHLSKVLVDHGGPFTATEITALGKQVELQCDGKQGSDTAPDKIMSDPAACYAHFDIKPLFCPPGVTTECIEQTRAEAVLPAFYEPYKVAATVSTPELVSPGYDLGSEWQWAGVFGVQADGSNLLNTFNMNYQRNFLNQPDADVKTYSDDVVAATRAEGAGRASVPPFDLTAFHDRGGKLILYHGMADGLLPRRNTEAWFTQAGGTGADAFMRYFEVPGMGHCAGSSSQLPLVPWIFGGAGQAAQLKLANVGDGWTNVAIPSNPPKAEADALTALVDWVAGGSGPTEFLAGSLYYDYSLSPPQPWTTRFCAYPKKANFTGGDWRSKDNYKC